MTNSRPVPARAMVLAAGRGDRLRPVTDTRAKPLVEVGGKALIDHVLDRLAAVGVARAVVNVSYLGRQIEDHLAKRRRPEIVISRESERLETGGGVARALPSLGPDPFYVVNSDALWFGAQRDALTRLADAWDEEAMDGLLLMQPTVRAIGYEDRGDFHLGPLGELRRRGERDVAPFVFAGVQILHPRLFEGCPEGVFSLNRLYDQALGRRRLFAIANDGDWLHVGTPEGLAQANRFLPRAANS